MKSRITGYDKHLETKIRDSKNRNKDQSKRWKKCIGPILISIMISLLLYVLHIFLSKVLLQISMLSPTLSFVNLIFGVYLLINILFNYTFGVAIVLRSPEKCEDPSRYFGQSVDVEDEKFQFDISPGVYFRYCKICKAVKPPRTHHCR